MNIMTVLELYVSILLTIWFGFDMWVFFKQKKKTRVRKASNVVSIASKRRSGEK